MSQAEADAWAATNHAWVSWDRKYDRPVVDGKVTNPFTGEVEETSPPYRAGPPAVDCIVHIQVSAERVFRGMRCSFMVPVDDVLLEAAKHVRDGLYTIVSLNVSAYSFVLICKTEKTSDEFMAAWHKTQEYLATKPVGRQPEST